MSYSEKDGQVIPELPVGCGYQGYEFGASYPDSICCGGKLYDADNCDNAGNLYDPGEDVPCPMCRHEDAVKYWYERNRLSGAKVRDATAENPQAICPAKCNLDSTLFCG